MISHTPTQYPIGSQVNQLANQLLAKAGFGWDGRPMVSSEETRKQRFFERRCVINTPVGGSAHTKGKIRHR